jgi:hypothetical protein
MSIKAELIEKFDTPEMVVRVYNNGFIESFTKENAHIGVPYLLEEKRKLLALNLGKRFFVLSESGGFFRITREARELSASREYSEHLAAVAVVATHFSTRLVMDLYFKINKPVVPTRSFTSRHLALLWLHDMMKETEKMNAVANQGLA